jgi:rod shape-determining protein MreD
MRRLIVVVAVLAAALLVQLTIVNRLPLPGGGVPDLVLLCVVGIGLVAGPRPGLIAGFCAGLALDLAPPQAELVGQYALVFCLVGYVSGRFTFTLRQSAAAALAAATGAVVLGEVLVGALAVVLDTPEVTFATVARLLPAAVIYDVILSPVVLFAAVRIAIALEVSFNPLDDSPALEPGGSATPIGLARLARLRQTRHALASNGMGPSSWLTGDSAASVPAIGEVGWLSGPATTRKARREQARLTAALTGAEPRKGAVWVGSKPAGLRQAGGTGTATPSSGLGRLRPDAGVAGSATREGLTGAAGGAQQPRASGVPKIAFGSDGGNGRAAGRRADPGVPKIAFGTGGLPGSGRATGRGVPKIAFGGRSGESPATQSQAPAADTPKIAFGTGGLPGEGRAGGRGVPRIRFGNGGLPGGGRARPRRTPSIAFGSGLPAGGRARPRRTPSIAFGSGLPGGGRARPRRTPSIAFGAGLPKAPRTSPGRPALPRFSSGTARSASGPWLAGSRLRSAQFGTGGPGGRPAFGGGPRRRLRGVVPARRRRGHRPKAARWGRKRRYFGWLPFSRRTGGRSAVWRISRQIGGER